MPGTLRKSGYCRCHLLSLLAGGCHRRLLSRALRGNIARGLCRCGRYRRLALRLPIGHTGSSRVYYCHLPSLLTGGRYHRLRGLRGNIARGLCRCGRYRRLALRLPIGHTGSSRVYYCHLPSLLTGGRYHRLRGLRWHLI